MRVAIVTPQPVAGTVGGAERAWAGLCDAINQRGHHAELVSLPVEEHRLVDLVDAYRRFAALDLSAYDLVISSKYPAWIAAHPHHVVHMFHTLRGLYDTYHLTGLPLHLVTRQPDLQRLLDTVRGPARRDLLPEFFTQFDAAVGSLGPDDGAFAFPGPLAREVVHYLDRVALDPTEIRRHFALSATVAARPDYFPLTVNPAVLHLPSGLPGLEPPAGGPTKRQGFFTASRLDGPKRMGLLVEAMAHVTQPVSLSIAGTGPELKRLQSMGAGDPRIEFLGQIDDRELLQRYQHALAVPFVPADEDLGLITLEAMACATPVLTTTDAGGPTEFVINGVNGLVTSPTPVALGLAMDHLAGDPPWAARLGAAAERSVRGVTWDAAVDALLDLAPASSRATQPSASGAGARRPKVVVTSTYAINPPRGGGQLRYAHLYGALAVHADVHILSLVNPARPTSTTELSPGLTETIIGVSDTQFEADVSLSRAAGIPITDIIAGQDIDTTPAYLDALRTAAADADVVLLSHPYLLPAIEAIDCNLPLIYDAHNAEADMKDAALSGTAIGQKLAAWTAEVEGRAVTRAAHIVTCSSEDAAALGRRYGRESEAFVLIPNGTVTERQVPSEAERRQRSEAWRTRWAESLGRDQTPEGIGVFMASWHPPNLDAAEVLFDLAADVPELVFVLAGSHSDHFRARRLPPNIVLAGVVSDQAKHELLATADVALNPMRKGSGTNLKIVEYFAAGIPTISTPFGARGLDAAAEHLWLTDVDGFPAAIREVLANPEAAGSRASAARHLVLGRYDWQTLGDELAQVVLDASSATFP